MVEVIGKETIRAIASAGPEMQLRLLQGLGLHVCVFMCVRVRQSESEGLPCMLAYQVIIFVLVIACSLPPLSSLFSSYQSTLITDEKSPINLFNTANGLVGSHH